jgi:hypothetical protein
MPLSQQPAGSRTKLSNSFLNDLHAEWEAGGRDALKIARIEKPVEFCRMVAQLMPQEFGIESQTLEAWQEWTGWMHEFRDNMSALQKSGAVSNLIQTRTRDRLTLTNAGRF